MLLKEKSKGFTLIELLVVISIIALLLSILMPALGRAKEGARKVICRSNLKSLTLGATLWANANDGWALPHSWHWGTMMGQDDPDDDNEGYANPGSLRPYVDSDQTDTKKNVFSCPSAKFETFFSFDDRWIQDNPEDRITYGMNGWIILALGQSPGTTSSTEYGISGSRGVHGNTHGSTKLINIRQPSDTVMFMDHERQAVANWNFDPRVSPLDVGQPSVTRWHKGRKNTEFPGYGVGNIGWVDGHVSQESEDFAERWEKYFWDH